MRFKKKFVCLLAATCSFMAFSGGLVYGSTLGAVNGDNVNVRSDAGTNSSIITKYGVGQAVEITGQKNGFYKINVDGSELYISSEFIDILKTEATINGNNVNLRDRASMESRIITKLEYGETVVVVGIESGQWLKVEYASEVGYISKDFVSGDFVSEVSGDSGSEKPIIKDDFVPMQSAPKAMPQDTVYAVVSSSTGLRLRTQPSTDSQVLTLVPSGEAVDVLNQQSGWVLVSYAGYEGYVSEEFIQISFGQKPVNTDSMAYQIIEYGKQFLGTPYQWAGNDLNKGVDCSGFVYNVFLKFGIKLNRSSSSMVDNGTPIDKANLKAGDLVFFDTTGVNDGGISHVGIYMGDGNFIHSSSSKRTWGVVISSLSDEYYIRTYVSARSVL